MAKRDQNNRRDLHPDIGGILSLLWMVVLLSLATFITAQSTPLEGWNEMVFIGMLWVMAISGILSALLYWRKRVNLGMWISIFSLWVGVLVLTRVTEGFGLILGVVAFIGSSSFAAQHFPVKQINQVMAVGALVGGAAFFEDIFGPAGRMTAPENLRFYIPIVAGVALFIFSAALIWQSRRLSLLSKLLLPIVTIALCSIAALAVYNYNMTRQALFEAKNQALKATAQQTATSISAFIDSARTTLVTEARLPEFVEYMSLAEEERLGSDQEARALTLLQYLQTRGYILSYNLLDTTGKVWLSTSVSPEQVDQIPMSLGIDLVDRGFLNLLLLTRQPYISPVVFAPNENPSIYFAMRIDNAAGIAIGVLVSQYAASNLQAIVAKSNFSLMGLVGEGSFAVLLDENNFRLAQGEDPGVLYQFVTPLDQIKYQDLLSSRRIPDAPLDQISTNYPSFQEGLDRFSEKTPFFAALEAGTNDQISSVAVVEIKDRKWKVAFMQPQSAFLQPVEQQSRTVILLALGIAVLVSLSVGFVARLIIRPIGRLTHVAEIVTAGDLSAQAQVTSQDEIGVLSKAFNTMTTQLRQTLEGLEQRVRERTRESEKATEQMGYRANQLQTVSEVARAIATVQDIDHLLPRIAQTISERFGYYHVGIFLLDPHREYAVLRAANSEGGQRMLARNHRLKVGQVGIVGYVSERGEPRIALDVGQDAVFFDNPDLPETRSEMALPLKIGENVIGALDVQSKVSSAFKDEDIALLTTLADQVAIAIENSRLFSETQQALDEAQTAQREYLRSEWEKVSNQQDLIGYQYTFGRVTNLPQSGDGMIWNEMEEELVIPIALRGQAIGVIRLQDIDQKRSWNEEEISLIKEFADQVGLALENARLLEATQRRAEREYLVGQITTKLRASNDPQVILQTAVTELRKALHAQKAQVIIQARPAQEVEPRNEQNQPTLEKSVD